MAYSDFTLKKVKESFGLSVQEGASLFAAVTEMAVSSWLQATLARNLPLALAINTEKARSELLIINLLLEARAQLGNRVSLFSGIDFTVDRERGLNGFCDYVLSNSDEQFYLDSPVVMVVEAKNENIISGLGQCVAEMHAAQLYNAQEKKVLSGIYGAVTTGNEWKFLKLDNMTVYIDQDAYYINQVAKIIGILVSMVRAVD
ncbi:conserved hypothetical protein [Gammaproteobacteria bacterium]